MTSLVEVPLLPSVALFTLDKSYALFAISFNVIYNKFNELFAITFCTRKCFVEQETSSKKDY